MGYPLRWDGEAHAVRVSLPQFLGGQLASNVVACFLPSVSGEDQGQLSEGQWKVGQAKHGPLISSYKFPMVSWADTDHKHKDRP